MSIIFLDKESDLDWLQEVQVSKSKPDLRRQDYRSAVVTGNEDAPHKIELFSSDSPTINDEPVAVIFP